MTPRFPASVSAASVTLLLAACASDRNLVVVLPEANGHVGAVVVQSGASRALLNKAYAAATPSTGAAHALKPGAVTEAKVQKLFGDALAALPRPPESTKILFDNDSSVISTEALVEFRTWLATQVSGRAAVEVVITGHTDRQVSPNAPPNYNDDLSGKRAVSAQQQLLSVLSERGIVADSIVVQRRGSRDANPKGPESDPNERYVEITIR